jgi:hypothetical protein
MMSQKLILFLILILTIGTAKIAHAEGGASGSQLGVLYGQSVPDADNANPRRFFGVKGSAFLGSNFSFGGYVLNSQQDIGTGGTTFTYMVNGIEATYHLGGGSGDTFVGARVGLTKVRTDVVSGIDAIYSPYHYGIVSGYDFPIMSWFSVGFEGSFLHVEKSSTTKSGTTYTLEGFSVINFLVSLQFRL